MNYNKGDRIGDYEIVDILGAGGMGRVYKVRNIISERIEAMKVLLPNLESDALLPANDSLISGDFDDATDAY